MAFCLCPFSLPPWRWKEGEWPGTVCAEGIVPREKTGQIYDILVSFQVVHRRLASLHHHTSPEIQHKVFQNMFFNTLFYYTSEPKIWTVLVLTDYRTGMISESDLHGGWTL